MKKRPQIDFVYFDLGHVLIKVDKDVVARGLYPFSGLKSWWIDRIFSREYIADESYGFWSAVDELDRGSLYPHQFYEKVCRELKLEGLSFEKFLDIWSEMTSIDEDVRRIANVLRTQDKVRLGIISDLCLIHYNAVMRLLDRDAFAICFFSFMEGCLKREYGGIVFQRAIRAANVPAKRILFIDDRKPNIQAAANCGLLTFHYKNNHKELEAYLEELGCDMEVARF